MKKKLTIALLAALALGACSEQETIENGKGGQQITFVPTIATDWNGAVTRATMQQNAAAKVQQLTDGLYLHTVVSPGFESDRQQQKVTRGTLVNDIAGLGGHFGVSAYQYAVNGSPTTSNFFSNVDVAYSGGQWTTNQTFTWPAESDTIDFYGYAPYNNSDVVVVENDASGAMKINYTVNAVPTQQADLMTAVQKKHRHISGNTNTVDMAFTHQLTAIKLALGTNVVPGHIKAVWFENIATTGTLTVSETYSETDSWVLGSQTNDTLNLVTTGMPDGFSTTTGTPAAINAGAELTQATTPLLMIPQNFTQDTQRLGVIVNDGSEDKNLSVSLKGTKWQPGTTVTYVISTSSINTLKVATVTYPTTWNTASTELTTIKSGYSNETSDALGIYAIDVNGDVVLDNAQLTKTANGWTTAALFVPGLTYFAYYPYNADGLAHSGTKNNAVVTEAKDFFAQGITAWTPATDQSDAAKLNAQDLQVGIGTVTSASTLSFTMTHAMGLVKVLLGSETFTTANVKYTAGGSSSGDPYTRNNQTVVIKAAKTLTGSSSPYWNGDAFYYVVNGSKTFASAANIHNEWTAAVEASLNSGEYKVYTAFPKDNTATYTYQGRYYPCTKQAETFTVPEDGVYKIECWGAQGGNIVATGHDCPSGGGGGFVSGYISLKGNTNLYVYVGEAGINNSTTRSFNGGGRCAAADNACASGGGATDVRLVSGNWYDFNSLLSRIIVAGGGAGSERSNPAGAAGGLNSTASLGTGVATQTGGYRLGYGEDADMGATASGAGGGYWGGLTSGIVGNIADMHATLESSGGSSFIAGHDGCIAIASATTGTRNILSNLNYQVATTEEYDIVTPSTGSVVTVNNTAYQFTNTLMIDGRGYRWINYRLNTVVGMESPSGANETGHAGNGYCRITLPIPVPVEP